MSGERNRGDRPNRAVSPVIGVILMVAITVILAAVIGAFVLEIGDQQETAPNTSFNSEQETIFWESWARADNRNFTRVSLGHAGGDTLAQSQIAVSVNGQTSVWHMPTTDEPGGDVRGNTYTVPDLTETEGSNKAVTIESGESLKFNLYAPEGDVDHAVDGTISPVPSHEDWKNGDFRWADTEGQIYLTTSGTSSQSGLTGSRYDPVAMSHAGGGGGGPRALMPLQTGDQTRVIWEASSGGKSQTLFKYSVQ